MTPKFGRRVGKSSGNCACGQGALPSARLHSMESLMEALPHVWGQGQMRQVKDGHTHANICRLFSREQAVEGELYGHIRALFAARPKPCENSMLKVCHHGSMLW